MLFHSLEFWIFFPVVLVLFYALPFRPAKFFLLAASYIFYMWWNPAFILLIVASTIIDYIAGRKMLTVRPERRKLLLWVSLVSNLGLLGFFKYYNFFTNSVGAAFGLQANFLALDIILPVGISFYTFQSMSYTIDIYRGKLKPLDSFTDFALFVAFFPQLVAGPIVRASEFLPQLDSWAAPRSEILKEGVHLILVGLIKKMVFADNFALASDLYFKDPSQFPGWIPAWTGVLAFGMQIFFDFSGYTDIARGCGKLLGFEFPLNFARPYLAQNIQDFWHRWHISLSTWLRDYLYIPLGGNRKGNFSTQRNLLLTMLLGGLWHGASWNFVIWGGYHGLLLLLHRMFTSGIKGTAMERFLDAKTVVPFKVAFNLVLVFYGWVFFRASTFEEAWQIFSSMSAFSMPGESLLGVGLWVAFGVYMIAAALEEKWSLVDRLTEAPFGVRVSVYVTCFLLLELFAYTDNRIPFVYFQF